MYDRIKPSEVEKLYRPNIIDIREEGLFAVDHLEGAINIPADKLLGNYRELLNVRKKYYLYCDYGIRSKKVCQELQKKGYSVSDIIDGYEGLKEFNNQKMPKFL